MVFLIPLVIMVYRLNEIMILIPRKNTHITHRRDFFSSPRDKPVKPDVSWEKKPEKTPNITVVYFYCFMAIKVIPQ